VIRPSEQLLTDKKICGVRFYVPSSGVDSTLYIWLSTTLPASAEKANIAYKQINLSELTKGKMNDVLFDEPYTIGTSNVYIGYTITTTEASVKVVPGCTAAGTDACWIKMSTTYNSWTTANASPSPSLCRHSLRANSWRTPQRPPPATDIVTIPTRHRPRPRSRCAT